MPINPILPNKNLPTFPSGSGHMGRAQNVSLGKLKQKEKIEGARVSIGQVLTEKSRQESGKEPVFKSKPSSNKVISSLGRPKNEKIQEEAQDSRRFAYSQKKIQEEKQAQEDTGLDLKAGRAYSKKKIHKKIKEFMKKNSALISYKGKSSEEREAFENVVGNKLKAKKAGSDLTKANKRDLKASFKKQTGKSSKFFKRMIGKL